MDKIKNLAEHQYEKVNFCLCPRALVTNIWVYRMHMLSCIIYNGSHAFTFYKKWILA